MEKLFLDLYNPSVACLRVMGTAQQCIEWSGSRFGCMTSNTVFMNGIDTIKRCLTIMHGVVQQSWHSRGSASRRRLARRCLLGAWNGIGKPRNKLNGSAVFAPLIDRQPTRLLDSRRVFSFTDWIDIRLLFVILQPAGSDPIGCSLLVP